MQLARRLEPPPLCWEGLCQGQAAVELPAAKLLNWVLPACRGRLEPAQAVLTGALGVVLGRRGAQQLEARRPSAAAGQRHQTETASPRSACLGRRSRGEIRPLPAAQPHSLPPSRQPPPLSGARLEEGRFPASRRRKLRRAPPEMPAKTPIYVKTSTPRRRRKLRLRDVLSSDMISPPLGDFRHSAHIGLDGEGDMFGELSFLQGRHDLLPCLGHHRGGSPVAGGGRALLKSAVSLPAFSGTQGPEQAPPKPPRLHLEEAPGGPRSMSVSCAEGLPFSARAHYEPLPASASFSAPPPEGCFRRADSRECAYSCGSPPPRSESLLRLDLDLGPSILDDVLRIMEEHQRPAPKAL
ncbi:hypothetical protein lerEdw1_009925 [Lerista edwardsae]|nr:hypothetical protein lerEdw1_009925 [Lerista edwardsae]